MPKKDSLARSSSEAASHESLGKALGNDRKGFSAESAAQRDVQILLGTVGPCATSQRTVKRTFRRRTI
jgi:hypothetical protein